ncbi:MAG TPA: TolC family protein, partial [Gemmatimonadales bacterium]|nr:TolC family protein [Gemmatimonadales bacterium]
MTYRRSLLVPALVAALAAPASAQQRSVSLSEAITMAQRVQPATVQAQGAIRSADAQKLAAYGEFMPSVNYTASASTAHNDLPSYTDQNGQVHSKSSTSNTFSNGISASIDLFTGLRRGADLSAATASQRAADAGLVNARYQVALTTTQSFITALT